MKRMAKEEIMEGLRVAMNKGEPFKKAMMSFYNAGFKKEDIEGAAKALAADLHQQRAIPGFQQITQTSLQVSTPQIQTPAPTSISQPTPIQPAPQFRQLPQSSFRNVQMVSDYTQKSRPASLVITIVLVFALLFLLGILATVFLFKEELTRFFSGGFWMSFLN